MQDLIKYLLDQIVAHPEDVQIEKEQDGRRLTFHVKVHPDDLGAVIGRSGRTINAIRTLVSASATQNDELGSCWVKLVDSDGGKAGRGDEEEPEDVEAEDEVDADDEEPVDESEDDGDVVYDDEDEEDEENAGEREGATGA